VGRIAADERDEWEVDLGGQGDPFALVQARASTFWDWKIFEASTPLDFETSAIWRSWRLSDQRLFEVPCPACGGRQPLVWRDGEGEEDRPEGAGQYRLVCEQDAAGELVPASARYQCAHCDVLIEERHKPAMLLAGQWVARHPQRAIRGYRLGGLYSPWHSWAALVEQFLTAKSHPATLKTFVNTRLGLPWHDVSEAVEPHFLEMRAEGYTAAVPAGVGLLTCGVDVQADRLEAGVWGWGAGEESWVIAQRQLEGDPGQEEVWASLAALLRQPWPVAGGRTLLIASMAIDAGYQPDRVHRFCLRAHRAGRPVIATVGRDGRGRPLLTAPGASAMKRARQERHASHILGTDSGKDALASRLKVRTPGPLYVHFPSDLDPVFFEQLTAEVVRTVYVNARPVRKWTLRDGRRNEALDCAVLAHAALVKLGPRIRAQLGPLATQLTAPAEGLTEDQPAPPASSPPRRTSWVNDW
jgi:phage terminase large subunit GpA-like protein